MAKVNTPFFVQGLSGRVGNIVFRQRNGHTYASAAPSRPPGPPSAAQLKQQARFRLACAFASQALADPQQAAFYDAVASPGQRSFAVAIRDFLKSPSIDEIALGLFDGLAGDEIIITASDDTEVARVHVAIRDSTGRLLESGVAENRVDDTWVYAATAAMPAGQPLTIEVTAKDRPGNESTRSAAWVPRLVVPSGFRRRGVSIPPCPIPRLIT